MLHILNVLIENPNIIQTNLNIIKHNYKNNSLTVQILHTITDIRNKRDLLNNIREKLKVPNCNKGSKGIDNFHRPRKCPVHTVQ